MLLVQAEASGVRYMLWHLGPTPATVRRELLRAQRTTGQGRRSNFARPRPRRSSSSASIEQENPGEPTTDPFAARQFAADEMPNDPLAATGAWQQPPQSLPPQPLPPRQLLPQHAPPQQSASLLPLPAEPQGAQYAGDPLMTEELAPPEHAPLPSIADLGQPAVNPFKNPTTPPVAQTTSPHGQSNSAIVVGDAGESPSGPTGNSTATSFPLNDVLAIGSSTRYADTGKEQVAATSLQSEQANADAAARLIGPPTGRLVPPATAMSVPDAPLVAPEAPTELSAGNDKQQALELMARSRSALAEGDLSAAEALARQASALNVAESRFLPGEDRPSTLAWDIERARGAGLTSATPAAAEGVNQAVAEMPENDRQEVPALHVPETDTTKNVPAITRAPSELNSRYAQLPGVNDGSSPPLPARLPQTTAPISRAAQLLEEGEDALRDQDRAKALESFREAEKLADELDPLSQQRLRSHLQMLMAQPEVLAKPPAADLMNSATEDQTVVARQLSAEVTKQQSEASRLRGEDPRRALEILNEVRQQVVESNLAQEYSSQLLRRIDYSIDETERYIEDHRAEIELDEQNKAVLAEVERRRAVKIKVQQDIAELVSRSVKS